MPDPKKILQLVTSSENMKRIEADRERYMVYNGNLKDLVKKRISEEFLLKETIQNMIGRITPINLTAKVTDKLAQVYNEAPQRDATSGFSEDDEALEFWEDELRFDVKMKHANRLVKLHKHTLLWPFLNRDGFPGVRVLPSHTYTPISSDMFEPERPTEFVIHQNMEDPDPATHRHIYWSDEKHFTMDGQGNVIIDPENPDFENPFNQIPGTYLNTSLDSVLPVSDDDLICVNLLICLLLTDMCYAFKYQAWSIIALIGIEDMNLNFNPNSVISIPRNEAGETGDIKTIKPDMDSDQMLNAVEALVGMLLTTKGLSLGSVTGKLTVSNAASGISKMIDQSETTEDRRDQIALFDAAESEFWNKFAHVMLPYWRETGQLHPDADIQFSEQFDIDIKFQEPKVITTDMDKVQLQLAKLQGGLTTQEQAIRDLHPQWSEDRIQQFIQEIAEDKAQKLKDMQESMTGQSEDDDEDPEDEEDDADEET